MRMIVSLILLLSLSGCYTTIERFSSDIKDTDIQNLTKDEILKRHFTNEAYEAIKDIPIVEAHIMGGAGFAAGTNFWSKVFGMCIGIGIERKVAFSTKLLENSTNIEKLIVHEYIHHLHDMQLDGDGNWIDEEEFIRAYEQTSGHYRYAGIVHTVERHANNWITNIFGISDNAEYIAYTGDICAMNGCPDFLGRVYKKILRKFQ